MERWGGQGGWNNGDGFTPQPTQCSRGTVTTTTRRSHHMTAATAAREARQHTTAEAVGRRLAARNSRLSTKAPTASGGCTSAYATGGASAHNVSNPYRPSIGLAAASLQQEWGRRLGLPLVNTAARRRPSAATSTTSATTTRCRFPAVGTRPSRHSAPTVLEPSQDEGTDGEAHSAGLPSSGRRASAHHAATCRTRGHHHHHHHQHHGNSTDTPKGALPSHKGTIRRHESHPSTCIVERPVIVPPKPTLAQRLQLVPAPAEPLTEAAWAACKQKALDRGDGTSQPCAICLQPFGSSRQVLLSCTHVFHYYCLRSYERHTDKTCCPVCRLEQYQGLEITEGARHHRIVSATLIQAAWRGHIVRQRLEAQGRLPRCTALPRTQRRLTATTNRLAQSVENRAGMVDRFLAELDASSARCKAVISDAHRRVVLRPLPDTEWVKIEQHARANGRFEGDCAICYQTFASDRDNPSTLLSCGHVLHRVCLEALERYAFSELPTCPCCRSTYRKCPTSMAIVSSLPYVTVVETRKALTNG
eukprot:m.46608 g.46608  ORF g.46608 m.46608 type:complete len:532 (+) comp6785_c0_seq1:326-1921(+)